MEQKTPNYREWKKENPRKSINDFYSLYGKALSTKEINHKSESNGLSRIDNDEETKLCPFCVESINIAAIKCKHCGAVLNKKTFKNSQIVSIIFAAALIIGYFLPWIDFHAIIQFSIYGFQIPSIANTITNLISDLKLYTNQELFTQSISYLSLFHLIPICSLIIIIQSAANRVKGSKIISEIFIIAIMTWFTYIFLKQLDFKYFLNLMGIGFYIAIVSSIYFVIDLFIEISRIK